jgi:hypothetical protein
LGLEVEQMNYGIGIQSHLDTYIQELIDEHRLLHKEFIKPNTVPMSPGLMLDKEDCPELPYPVKHNLLLKHYRSVVSKIQFAAYWVRFDISYTVAQLTRFWPSAGPSHWAALTNLIGYLVHRPSLKLKYRREAVGGLYGFSDSDWGNSRVGQELMAKYAGHERAALAPLLWRSKEGAKDRDRTVTAKVTAKDRDPVFGGGRVPFGIRA